MIEFCIVMHCGADRATGAPQTFFYNNKLQISDLTTNRAVGGSSFFEAQQRFDDIGSVSCMACKQTEFELRLVREFCVTELCIVMHCSANWATDAPVTY